MKKLLIFFTVLLFGAFTASAATVNLGVGYDDHTGAGPGNSKTPVSIPYLDITGHVATFEADHPGFTLSIIDENDNIVYSVYVPSSVTIVNLPSTLSGDYELRLYPDGSTIYFYGYVVF